MHKRDLVVAVLGCIAGAAAALLAARATWAVEVTPRPAPFPAERNALTGGDRQPWLPALAWVALAGAGALLATRGAARRAVGVLLVLAGAGMTVACLTAAAESVLAPAAAATGGLVIAGAGALTVARGHRWPAMGSRYERPRPARDGLWDALDRGEDPTH